MWKFIKFIFVEGIMAFVTSEFFITIVGPTVVAVLIGALGYVQAFPMPLSYLVAAMALGFGATATGVLRISEYRQRVSIDGKVAFSRPTLNVALAEDEKKIERISLGFQLSSSADFPIEFQVVELETEINQRVPVNKFKKSEAKTLELPPRGSGFYRDGDIEIGEVIDKRVEGRITFKVNYWRAGAKKKASVSKNLNIILSPGVQGQLLALEHLEVKE